MTLARANRNPGNIKQVYPANWKGSIGADARGHAIFEDLFMGCRCMIRNVAAKYLAGKRNITEIITAWAPPSDGNVPSEYIRAVCRWTGFNDIEDLRLVFSGGHITNAHYFLLFSRAIEHYEDGNLWVPESNWFRGLAEYYKDYVEVEEADKV